jgi:hypothetical protein
MVHESAVGVSDDAKARTVASRPRAVAPTPRAARLYGRRRLFTAGLRLFASSCLPAGLADSGAVLLAGRPDRRRTCATCRASGEALPSRGDTRHPAT